MLAGERFCGRCGALAPDSGAPPTLSDGTGSSPWDIILRQLRENTLGEFDIKRELGRGGMAAVYLAHEIALNRKVALKVMAPGLILGEGMLERFRFEAVTVANLAHPHIVRMHAVREAGDMHFFVMQYLPGRSLERVVRVNGPLPIPIIRVILSQVGNALGYAHKRGVIHRDIKPANILFDVGGDAIVTDFGIAKLDEESGQTLSGSVVGTPSYMSPEQCYARKLTGASDQYSLGIVAFEMLTGSAPFVGAAYPVMQGHTHGTMPSIAVLRPDCPPDLEVTVNRMLSREAGDRFASMADAVKAISAQSLDEYDGLRREMITLAAIEENAALDASIPTLRSPIPTTKPTRSRATGKAADVSQAASRTVTGSSGSGERTVVASDLSAADQHSEKPAGTRRLLSIGLPALAAAAALIFYVANRSTETVTSASLTANGAGAQVSPRDSVPAPATTAAPAATVATLSDTTARPPEVVPPKLPATSPDKPLTKPSGSAAQNSNANRPIPPAQSAPRDSVTRPLPSTSALTALAEPPARAPEKSGKSAAELRTELEGSIHAYASAIETRDYARMRAVYPNIQQSQLDAYRTFFDFARDVKVFVQNIDVTDALTSAVGSEAHARVSYTIQYHNNSTRKDEREPAQWQVTLQRSANGWQLVSLR